jgi:hypothetical protein
MESGVAEPPVFPSTQAFHLLRKPYRREKLATAVRSALGGNL